jgi:hypothetical protein
VPDSILSHLEDVKYIFIKPTMMPLNLAPDALIYGRHLLHDHVSSHRDLVEMMSDDLCGTAIADAD